MMRGKLMNALTGLTIIRYTSCTVATLQYWEPFRSVNYIRIVASLPNALKAFFYGETISLLYHTTMMTLPHIIYI